MEAILTASDANRLEAFPFPAGSRDVAARVSLAPGSYTAVISPESSTTPAGIALGEIYENDNASIRLVNLSARGFVSADTGVMIPAFVTSDLAGGRPKKMLVRGIGPGLAQFGVTNVLANPRLSVIDRTGRVVASNDDWEQNDNLAELRAVTAELAFPLAAGGKDAAILVAVPPGAYTCVVSPANDTTGTALVEIYEVP